MTVGLKPARASVRDAELKVFFDDIHARFHRPEFLPGDPLHFAHRFSRDEDREVAALLAAAFASGNIKAILAVLDSLQGILGERPAKWLREHEPSELNGAARGLYHRWVRPEDVELLLAMLGSALRRHGTLGNLWQSLDDPGGETILPTLEKFVSAIQSTPVEPLAVRKRSAKRADGGTNALPAITDILLTSPSRGSACKRMNLFLRWMVRPADGIDFGLWTSFVSPARLIMPIDVHVLRICRKLRLTRRNVPDRRTAEEITRRMRRISPDDPCRYDFAIVRAGIAK